MLGARKKGGRTTITKLFYGGLFFLIILLALSGCYTKLNTVSGDYNSSYSSYSYDRHCYYETDYETIRLWNGDIERVRTYRQVCPDDRYYSTYRYLERYERYGGDHYYDRDYDYEYDWPAEENERPRRSTVGRSSTDADSNKGRADNRDRGRSDTGRNRTRRDTSSRR